MRDWITFFLAMKPDEIYAEKIDVLNELVGGLGIGFEVVDRGEGDFRLKVLYDEAEVRKKIKRNAGAKRKYISRSVPVAEIRSRMETETAEQIAKSLGISRPTLFRKLKYAEEWGYDYIM